MLLFSAVEHAIHRWFIFPGFLSLEEQQAEQDLLRVHQAIDNEIRHLDTFCFDWAAWDDTYQYVLSRSPQYISSNLTLSSFSVSHLNLVFIYDQQGRRLWGESYDLEDGQPLTFDLFEKATLASALVLPIDSGEGLKTLKRTGVVATEKGPLLLSVRPIVTTDNRGPVRGTMVMGRLLNAALLSTLAEQTRLAFTFQQNTADVGQEPLQFDKSDPQSLVSYQPFTDLNGQATFDIRLETPRMIILTVQAMNRHTVVFLALSSLVLVVFMWVALQRIVLGPICRVKEHAQVIHTGGDLSARLQLRRGDEIGQLANEFDIMMAEIDQKSEELASANHELQRLSSEDPVTLLANRRQFDTRLDQEWRGLLFQQRPLSLLLCDVDFFKLYNDSYGHQAGDRCLRAVAQAIRQAVHRPADLVARYGGEEFAVILVDTDLAGAVAVAEKICNAVRSLENPHRASLVEQHVTLSVGAASLVPQTELSSALLIEWADQSLYRAKQQGRNRVEAVSPVCALDDDPHFQLYL
jgi:diguanylate cyclase (GGDEF)-like protein